MPFEAPFREARVRSADGTELAWYTVGRGPCAWLMPPAMGAPLIALRWLLEPFADTHTIVTWDMRGFYRSGAPPSDDAYDMERHVEDLEAVRAAAGLDRFVLGGWSMGVQTSLEYVGRSPERVKALVLIHGPYERVLDTTPIPAPDRLAPTAVRIARLGAPVFNTASRVFLGAPGAALLLRALRLHVGDDRKFAEVLEVFRTVDWGRYVTVMKALHEHSAAAVLPWIEAPTLITCGTLDIMAPVRTARAMHRRIPGSELFVLEGGTHYSPVEFPEVLASRIATFLSRVS